MTGFDLGQAHSGWPAHIAKVMKAAKNASAVRSTSKMRSTGVAFLALFFLGLQPICAAYERHASASNAVSAAATYDDAHADDASIGPHDGTPCCPEMRAEAMASASPVAADKNFPAAGLMVALPLALAARPELTPRSHPAWNTPPPPPLPYHARSARILR